MSSRSPIRSLLRPLLFLVGVGVVLALGEHYGLRESLDPARLRDMGAEPSVSLLLAYAALWVLMMGGSVPATAASAAIFGWAWGAAAAMAGALLAHSGWFLLARSSLRPVVWSRAGPRVRWLITLVDRGGVGLVGAWSLLGGPGSPLLFAAALSRLSLRRFALGLLCMAPRLVLTALVVDTLLVWPPDQVPTERWLLVAGVGLPMLLIYGLLLWLRPELRPWRFGDPDLGLEPDEITVEDGAEVVTA